MKRDIFTYTFLLLITCLGAFALPEFNQGFTRRATGTVNANANAERWTNAKRLASGLAPRRPNVLYNPTRVSARRSDASPLPQALAYIKAKRVSTGIVLGYVTKDYLPSMKLFGFAAPTTPAQRMVIKVPAASGSQLNVEINTPAAYPYLGFAGTSLSVQSSVLIDTNPTTPGAVPSAVGNGRSLSGTPDSESALWTYDSTTLKIAPTWIEPTGSAVTSFLSYNPMTGGVTLVSNPPLNGYQVEFYLEILP